MYKIYRNLHNGKLSIKDGKTGLVVGHADRVDVFMPEFKVSKAGVARIRRDKRKSVVATVNGGIAWVGGFIGYKGRTYEGCVPTINSEVTTMLSFNPYKYESFVDKHTEEEVSSAEYVVIDGAGAMIAWGAR